MFVSVSSTSTTTLKHNVCPHQSRWMKLLSSRLSSLTAARLTPTWEQVQGYRRENTAWLSWRVTLKTPTPRIPSLCSTAAKRPSWLIKLTTPRLCIPQKSSPRILTPPVASWTRQPITWWVWGPAQATTQETCSRPLTFLVEDPRNKPCTKAEKCWCALWTTAAAPEPPLLAPSLRTRRRTPSPPWPLRSFPHMAHFLRPSHCSIFPWGGWWRRRRPPGTPISTACTANPQPSITGPSDKAESVFVLLQHQNPFQYFHVSFSSVFDHVTNSPSCFVCLTALFDHSNTNNAQNVL